MFQHDKAGLGMTDACKPVMPTRVIFESSNVGQALKESFNFNLLSLLFLNNKWHTGNVKKIYV